MRPRVNCMFLCLPFTFTGSKFAFFTLDLTLCFKTVQCYLFLNLHGFLSARWDKDTLCDPGDSPTDSRPHKNLRGWGNDKCHHSNPLRESAAQRIWLPIGRQRSLSERCGCQCERAAGSQACCNLSVLAGSSQLPGMGGTLLYYLSDRWLAVAEWRARRCVRFVHQGNVYRVRVETVETFLQRVPKAGTRLGLRSLHYVNCISYSCVGNYNSKTTSWLHFQPTWMCSPECSGLRSSALSQNTPPSDGPGRPDARRLPCT